MRYLDALGRFDKVNERRVVLTVDRNGHSAQWLRRQVRAILHSCRAELASLRILSKRYDVIGLDVGSLCGDGVEGEEECAVVEEDSLVFNERRFLGIGYLPSVEGLRELQFG